MKMPMGIVPGGRSVTVEPADSGQDASGPPAETEPPEPSRSKEPPKETGTAERPAEPMKKIKNLFGW
jgi:hypothetical protein